jgi:hypothetical protein
MDIKNINFYFVIQKIKHKEIGKREEGNGTDVMDISYSK